MDGWLTVSSQGIDASSQTGSWPAALVVVHAIGDGIMAAAFVLIPAALLYFVRKGDRSHRETALVLLFSLFIFAAGVAHFASLLTLWLSLPVIEGALKAIAALIALTAAIVLWRFAPYFSRLPSRERLQEEVAAHLRTSEELRTARHELEDRVEERTKELAEAKRRFEIALRGSPISVFSQDRDMCFTWVHNAPSGLSAEAMLGKTDLEVLPPEAAERIIAAKRNVMLAGAAEELETDFELFGRKRSFYLIIEPLSDESGAVSGTISVAVDVTERKANEDHLRLLLRELTHRSKNLLAVINAIARQTASRTSSMQDFLDRFSARLVAIGCSHDLLVADNWEGASLRTLIEQQLADHAELLGDKIVLAGDDVMLKPEAVQNVGLAIHELAVNATKFGALSTEDGGVDIAWRLSAKKPELDLVWKEHGGPAVQQPERRGFGRALIENAVGKALDGSVRLSFPVQGVECVISIPAAQILSREDATESRPDRTRT